MKGKFAAHSKMNFSWVIEHVIGGSCGPHSRHELDLLKECGVGALVRMMERAIAASLNREAQDIGLADLHEPVPDYTAPSQEQIDRMISFVQQCVSKEIPVGVSCDAGKGRTGTVLACYLVAKGANADDAIEQIRRLRPGSIETRDQEQAIHIFAQRLQTERAQHQYAGPILHLHRVDPAG
jgi:atypical dual specificity phosphatase